MTDPKKRNLHKELKYFEKNKTEYLKSYKNLFVLIKNEEFGGAFTTEAEAYQIGIEKYGNEPFLIKQVSENEQNVSFPALNVGAIHVNL